MHFNVSVNDFDALRISVASPQDILSWSYGEVTKPETINYRTQRPERGGLFCERIFGPTKNYRCYCGKYKRIRYKGVVCDRCGVEVTHSSVRRFRMGHIKLAAPVAHPWFLRNNPGVLSKILEIPQKKLEQVVYFAGYIVTSVNRDEVKKKLESIELDYSKKIEEVSKEFEYAYNQASSKEVKEKIEVERNKRLEEIRLELKSEKELLGLLVKKNILSEGQFLTLSVKYGSLFSAGIGASALLDLIKEIDLEHEIKKIEEALSNKNITEVKEKRLKQRLQYLKGMNKAGIDPEYLFLTVLPVIPPDLRPMVELDGGRFAASDINDLYRRIITRNNRLKKLISASAPEIITRNERRMLQEAVDALIDRNNRKSGKFQKKELKSLSDILRGKTGRFRQNLLGKRVDYSGRAVIVPGPNLKIDQCGIPKHMALELFQPFVISRLMKLGYAHNIKDAKRAISQRLPEVWDVLDSIVSGKVVLLNRAPTLHTLSLLSFKPVLVEGKAIQLHPLVCAGYNADFDGDQMAVHLPISSAAQKECADIMIGSKNLLKPSDGKPIALPSFEMVLGVYYLTYESSDYKDRKPKKYFSSVDEVIIALRDEVITLHDKIMVLIDNDSIKETTAGRIIFNSILPKNFGFVNQPVTNSRLKGIVFDCFRRFGMEVTSRILDEIKRIGFKFATYAGITYSASDLLIPDSKQDIFKDTEKKRADYYVAYKNGFITDEERRDLTIKAWVETKEILGKKIEENLRSMGSISYIVESGARGKFENINQVVGIKGLVSNPKGEVLEVPVKSSFKEGLTTLEYFIDSHGGRKGKSDTALKTSEAGYLTRRMIDVAQDIFVTNTDCGSKNGLEFTLEESKKIKLTLGERVKGRFVLQDITYDDNKVLLKSGELITQEISKKIDELGINSVIVRSVLFCKEKFGVCQKCYGEDPAYGRLVDIGRAVGIISAQSIGEPGLQLTLRTFHSGGTAGPDIIQGLPRVDELFEARSKSPCILSPVDGRVLVEYNKTDESVATIRIENKEGRIVKTYKDVDIKYLLVKDEDEVKVGQQITLGNIDPTELFELKGKYETAKYLLSEIQKVYVEQAQEISDKHIEVILSRMFSMVYVEDSGTTDLLEGTYVNRFIAESKNEGAKIKAKLKDVVLGISKTSKNTESFLSSASFEETTKTLIDSSIKGKVDLLMGLKENIMVGKLIPCGTGFRKDRLTYLDNDVMSKLEKVKFN